MSNAAPVHLDWEGGKATVHATAGMLSEVAFNLSGVAVHPFARAPWNAFDPEYTALPGHIRHLGAEFICLPFGGGGFSGAAPDWDAVVSADPDPCFHGLPAELDWTVEARSSHAVVLALDLPAPCPIRRLVRKIAATPQKPALDFTLTIYARDPCRLPLGLHPILRLPDVPQSLELAIDFQFGLTFAADGEAMGALLKGHRFTDLRQVPGRHGPLDFSRLPPGMPIEAVIQLCGIRSDPIALFRQEGFGIRLSWPRNILPSLQLWLSDRALMSPPWSGRYRGLGIEPVASVFDFGTKASEIRHPAIPAELATNVDFSPDKPFQIAYSIEAFEI